MMRNTSIPLAASPPARRSRKTLWQALLLFALASTAAWLWTGGIRQERALQHASFAQLRERVRRDPDNPRVFYYLGLRLRELGQYDFARSAFARADLLEPGNEATLLAWGDAASRAGKTQEAFTTFTNCVQQHPRSAAAHLAFAAFCHDHFALEKARLEAQATADLEPDNGAAWQLAGLSAMEMSDYDRAEPLLRKSVARQPKDWHTNLALGNTLLMRHREAEALPLLQTAYALAPDEVQPASALGRTLLQLAKTPDEIIAAQKILLHAVALNPNVAGVQFALGRSYARQARWQNARTALETSERVAPQNAQTHFELARVYAALGEKDRAAQESRLHDQLRDYDERKLQLGVQIRATDDPTRRLQLARLCASHGEVEDAILQYQTLLARHPERTDVAQELAALQSRNLVPAANPLTPTLATGAAPASGPTAANLLRDAREMLDKGHFVSAERTYRALLSEHPDAQANEGLGQALSAQGKTAEAFQQFTQALKQKPNLPQARFGLAKIEYDQGFFSLATARMEKLVHDVPSNALYLYALSDCYKDDSAHNLDTISLLEKAVALDPQSGLYQRSLGKAYEKVERPADAEPHYRLALQGADANASTRIDLANLLLNAHPTPARQSEAAQLFQQCLTETPDNPEALLGAGRAALVRGDARAALPLLQNALTHANGLPQGWYYLMQAYQRLGMQADAAQCRQRFESITAYNRTLANTEEQARLHLSDAGLRLKLARLYTKSDQYTKSLSQYYAYVSMKPQDRAAKQELDTLLAELKQANRLPSPEALKTLLLVSTRKGS